MRLSLTEISGANASEKGQEYTPLSFSVYFVRVCGAGERGSPPRAVPKSLPVFFEDQTVSGQVELDLQKPESIKSVEVTVSHNLYPDPTYLFFH